jgi:hypothetical protein
MTFLGILLFLVIIAAVLSIRYKIYLRVKITNSEKKALSFKSWPNIIDLWPMRIKYVPENEIKERRLANTALIAFYSSIIVGLILAQLIKNIVRLAKTESRLYFLETRLEPIRSLTGHGR